MKMCTLILAMVICLTSSVGVAANQKLTVEERWVGGGAIESSDLEWAYKAPIKDIIMIVAQPQDPKLLDIDQIAS